MSRWRLALALGALLAGCAGEPPAEPAEPPAPQDPVQNPPAGHLLVAQPHAARLEVARLGDLPPTSSVEGPRVQLDIQFAIDAAPEGSLGLLQVFDVRAGQARLLLTTLLGPLESFGSHALTLPATREAEIALLFASDAPAPRTLRVEFRAASLRGWDVLLEDAAFDLAAHGDFLEVPAPVSHRVRVEDGRSSLAGGASSGRLDLLAQPALSEGILYLCSTTTSVGAGTWSLRMDSGGNAERFEGATGTFHGGGTPFLARQGPAATHVAYALNATATRDETVRLLYFAVETPSALPFAVETLDSRDLLGPAPAHRGC